MPIRISKADVALAAATAKLYSFPASIHSMSTRAISSQSRRSTRSGASKANAQGSSSISASRPAAPRVSSASTLSDTSAAYNNTISSLRSTPELEADESTESAFGAHDEEDAAGLGDMDAAAPLDDCMVQDEGGEVQNRMGVDDADPMEVQNEDEEDNAVGVNANAAVADANADVEMAAGSQSSASDSETDEANDDYDEAALIAYLLHRPRVSFDPQEWTVQPRAEGKRGKFRTRRRR